jgi:hypothetical protein
MTNFPGRISDAGNPELYPFGQFNITMRINIKNLSCRVGTAEEDLPTECYDGNVATEIEKQIYDSIRGVTVNQRISVGHGLGRVPPVA